MYAGHLIQVGMKKRSDILVAHIPNCLRHIHDRNTQTTVELQNKIPRIKKEIVTSMRMTFHEAYLIIINAN